MLQVRVVTPPDRRAVLVEMLEDEPSVIDLVVLEGAATKPRGDVVQFDVPPEAANDLIEAMRNLVYAFYDHAFSFGDLLRNYGDLKGDITDCLIGNLFRDFDPLFKAVGEFAKLPEPLQHGWAAEA